jgi:hypothetical protein
MRRAENQPAKSGGPTVSRTRKHAIHPEIQALEERQLLSLAHSLTVATEHSQPMVVQPLLVSHHLKGPGKPTPNGGIPISPVRVVVPADLRVESLTLKDIGNGTYQYHAVVRNGDPIMAGIYNYQDYMGDGLLVLTKSSGEMIPNQPDANGDPMLWLAALDPGTRIAMGVIPRLSSEKTFELTGTTTGRGIYTVAALRGQPEDPPPVSNPKYASKTVDNLLPQSFDYPASEVGAVLSSTLGGAYLKLDSNDSEFKIPGMFDTHFQIPGKDVHVAGVTETYYVNGIVSTGVTASYSNGALVLSFSFADNNHALHTPAWWLPDVSEKNMTMTVTLPLVYDPAYQYIHYVNPSVSVHATWSYNGPAGVFSPGDVSKDFQDKVTSDLNDPKVQKQIEYAITYQFHQLYAGGHMTGVTFGPNDILVTAETSS